MKHVLRGARELTVFGVAFAWWHTTELLNKVPGFTEAIDLVSDLKELPQKLPAAWVDEALYIRIGDDDPADAIYDFPEEL